MKPRDSSDAEIQALEALCERLAGFDDRVSLEWLDGCMAALLAGPRALSPLEWLPRLLDDAWERTFADPQDQQQALDTLLARWNVLASQLDAEALFDDPDLLRLAPLLGDYGDAARAAVLAEGRLQPEELDDWPLTGELWALGVLEAIEAFADDWVAPTDNADDQAWYDGCLRAIEALTQRDAGAAGRRPADPLPGPDAEPRRAGRRSLPGAAGPALLLGGACAAPRTASRGQDPRPQRPLPLRQRQEVQEVPRCGGHCGLS